MRNTAQNFEIGFAVILVGAFAIALGVLVFSYLGGEHAESVPTLRSRDSLVTDGTEAQTPVFLADPDHVIKETQDSIVYQDSKYGFELEYPTTIRPFSEAFGVDEVEHVHHCRWFDVGHQSYADSTSIGKITLDPEFFQDLQCDTVEISLDEYVKRYARELMPGAARNSKIWKIPAMNGVEIYGLFWEIPLSGPTPDSPQIGWFPVFHLLVEPPQNTRIEGRALRFTPSGGTLSCPNSYCEFGETPAECPIDCKEDWETITSEIMGSIKFLETQEN